MPEAGSLQFEFAHGSLILKGSRHSGFGQKIRYISQIREYCEFVGIYIHENEPNKLIYKFRFVSILWRKQ